MTNPPILPGQIDDFPGYIVDEIDAGDAKLQIYWTKEKAENRAGAPFTAPLSDRDAIDLCLKGAIWMPPRHNFAAIGFVLGLTELGIGLDDDETLAVAITAKKRGARAKDALRILEPQARKKVYWPALVGSLMAAESLYQYNADFKDITEFDLLTDLSAHLTRVCKTGAIVSVALRRTYLPNDISELFSPTYRPPIPYEPEPSDIDIFANAINAMKRLWDPRILEEIREKVWLLSSDTVRERHEIVSMITILGELWGAISGIKTVKFCGLEAKIPALSVVNDSEPSGVFALWSQTMELVMHRISREPLSYFREHLLRIRINPDSLKAPYAYTGQHDYVLDLADEILKQAERDRRYSPEGVFRLAVPDGTGIDAEDVRIWLAPGGMWVLPSSDSGLFWWSPSFGLDRCWLPPFALSSDKVVLWHAFLSALWHDLLVGGDEVLVKGDASRAQLAEQESDDEEDKKRSRRRRRSAAKFIAPPRNPLRLPGKRVIYDGYRVWGTDEERERIKRCVHQVRGHPRKLRPGHQRSLRALDNARHYNFIIPSGYTFVAPHRRGLGDDVDAGAASTPETPIVARGLASLIAAMRQEK